MVHKQRTKGKPKAKVDIYWRKKPLPTKSVYDLSVLTVGDMLQELRARGFRGELKWVGDKK